MAPTKAYHMRFSDELIELMDAIQRKYKLTSRSDVVRIAIARLAEAEGIAPAEGKPKRKKSSS